MSNNMKWRSSAMGRYMRKDTLILGDSPYSVYEWSHNGKVFYVGMGKYYRFTNANEKSRSAEFMEIYNQGDCEVKLIACGMSEQETRRIERETIEKYIKSGETLVNKQYVVDYYHTSAHLAFYESRRKA